MCVFNDIFSIVILGYFPPKKRFYVEDSSVKDEEKNVYFFVKIYW